MNSQDPAEKAENARVILAFCEALLASKGRLANQHC
jgi:hypothetical protein